MKNKDNFESSYYALERGAKMVLSFVGPEDCRLNYLVENVCKIDSDGKQENSIMCQQIKKIDNNEQNVFEHGEGSVFVSGLERFHFGFKEDQTAYSQGLGFSCSNEEGVGFYTIPSSLFNKVQNDVTVVASNEENIEDQNQPVWQIDQTCSQ